MFSKNKGATAQGKQGIWKSIFPEHREFAKNMFLYRELTTNTGKSLELKQKHDELVILSMKPLHLLLYK